MTQGVKFPLRIFYDGSCMICSGEIDHYRQQDHKGLLIPIDISAAGFETADTGFSREELMYQLHAVDADGRVHTGVDAFQAIWQAFPESMLLGLLSALIALPLINPLARTGYWCFARLRRFLPRHHDQCSSGRCPMDR